MKQNFLQKIKDSKKGNPFFCLAPMADVTDIAFRQIIAKYSRHGKVGGGPDIFWTEFVSADGLISVGKKVLLKTLSFSLKEKPIIAQVFGSNPQKMEMACKIISKMGFAGIDINMGCPDKSVEKQGAGASLMRNPELAREIIRSAKKGAGKLPIMVKTRLGYNKNEYENWLPMIANEGVSAITIHGRTRKEMSKVPARWEDIKKGCEIIKKINSEIIVIGNGDIFDIKDGIVKAKISGVDGVMIGRGVFGKPWLFDSKINKEKTVEEKIKTMLEHTKLFEKLLKGVKNFYVMKKHFKAYITGFDGAKELRAKLMQTNNSREVEKIVKQFLNSAK